MDGSYTTLLGPRGVSLFRHQRAGLDAGGGVSHHGLVYSEILFVGRKWIGDAVQILHLLVSGGISLNLVVETDLGCLQVGGLIELGRCLRSFSCLDSHETSLLRISFVVGVVLASLELDQVALDGREAALVAHVGSGLSRDSGHS